jgi:hypothetical protein
MNIVKQLIELVYYYRQDTAHGKPYWLDPAFLALVVSLLATILARCAGIGIDADLQVKIVGVATGIGVALSPHTGVKKLVSPPAPLAMNDPRAGGDDDHPEHNLGSLS